MTSDIRQPSAEEDPSAQNVKSWKQAGLHEVGRQSVVDRIHEQILGLLRSGWLKPGDRIPPENELGELFRAGRSSVREALNMLAGANLIRRDRQGTYVTDAVQEAIACSLQTGILLGGATLHDLFEARKVYEVGIVELVAVRADDRDLEAIDRWTVDPESVHSVEEFRRVDMGFHSAIAAGTGNTVIVQIYEAVRGILFQSHAYYALLGVNDEASARAFIRSSLADHVVVRAAITEHDARRAREAMLDHLRHLEQRLTASAAGDRSTS